MYDKKTEELLEGLVQEFCYHDMKGIYYIEERNLNEWKQKVAKLLLDVWQDGYDNGWDTR